MVTKKAINSLIEKLNLPECDEFSQDWEYEVADSKRLEEFIEYYQNNDMDKDEKFTLMIIILESYNDIGQYNILEKKLWCKIEKILMEDKFIHKPTIDYWSCSENENIEDCFYITPLMRSLKKRCE